MISVTTLPKLWLSTPANIDGLDQLGNDCDCACSNSLDYDGVQVQSIIGHISSGSIQNLWLSKDIYLDQIEKYSVAVSARGKHVVVLDGQANCLLSDLKSPSSVERLRQTIMWPRDVLDRVLALLLAEGILVSPQMEQIDYFQGNSTELTAWLHLANGCNLSCHYCYLTFNGRQMDIATARRTVESIFRSAMIHNYSRIKLKYAGGEPTLNFKALLAAQQQAEKLSAQTNIFLDAVMLTNGVHLRDSQIDMLLSHNIRVMVSLDGMDDFQNAQRQLAGSNKSSFEYVSQTLDRLLERSIAPHISITITNKNIEGLPGLAEYLLDRGLRFSLNFYREPSDLPDYGALSFKANEIIAGLKSVYRLIERRLPPYSLMGSLTDLADLRMPHSFTCDVGRNYMVVNYNGNVAKCQMDIGIPVTTIDVADPLTFIREDTKGIQNLHVDEKDLQKCVWRYRCTGGCPRLTFQRTGRYDAKSPMCEIYEAILPEVVRLEALRLIRYEEPWDFNISRRALSKDVTC
jgi:uncharacterized protein